MNRKDQLLSPILRCFSAATLVIWIGAVVLCVAHCSFGVSHGSTKSACCKTEKPSGENEPASNLACLTFKSALLSDYSLVTLGIDSTHLYNLAALLAVSDCAFEPAPVDFRQLWQRESSITPAVCLDAANLSHAPPVLA